MPAGVSIIQDTRRGWGKTALQDPALREEALAAIDEVLQHYPRQENVGLITHQSFEPFVKKRFPRLKTGHYYGQRGSNEFAQLEGLLVFGTPSPNPQGLLQQAEALFYHQPPLARAQYLERRTLTMQSGPDWSMAVRTYQDPRLQGLLRSKREDELVQALYRVRPLSVQPSVQQELFPPEGVPATRLDCRIHVFSNLPLEGLKVTRLIERATPPAEPAPETAFLRQVLEQAGARSEEEEEGPRRQPTQAKIIELTQWSQRKVRALAGQLAALWLGLLREDFLASEAPLERARPQSQQPLTGAVRTHFDRRSLAFQQLAARRKEPPGPASASQVS
jgi:hypothetical protein